SWSWTTPVPETVTLKNERPLLVTAWLLMLWKRTVEPAVVKVVPLLTAQLLLIVNVSPARLSVPPEKVSVPTATFVPSVTLAAPETTTSPKLATPAPDHVVVGPLNWTEVAPLALGV